MKNNSALISTAILSAFFDEDNKDNISLLIPFVIKIIHDDLSSSEIDIVNKMKNIFSFYDFPRAIVKIIINRLKKQKIIKQYNGKFEFVADVSHSIKQFNDRHEKSKKQVDMIIRGLLSYFEKNTDIKMNYEDCKKSFALFLNGNGYLLYNNINESTRIKKNLDKITYNIGMFINEHKKSNDEIYSSLVNVIEGSLIANALYVNIDNDNKTDLNKLTCFFDTPFMLRVLEFKMPDENKTALELVELLRTLNVKIKCFRHNYFEIENILEEFIKHQGNRQEKTLENLIIKNYTDSDLRNLLNNLETKFKNLNIEIVETPEYTEEKYEHVIDEKKLKDNLLCVYGNKNVNIKTVEIDVQSVSAIMRLREGKEFRKLEDCNAIFVTTNKDIRIEANKLLNLDTNFKISPVISDLDLTAVTWLKSRINIKHVPEMKLTENAMAAIKPSQSVRKKIRSSLSVLNSSKIDVTSETLYNLLCSNYFVTNLMARVNGDPNKINPNVLLNTYEETLRENSLLTEKESNLILKNEDLNRKLLEKEAADKIYRDNILNKYTEKETRLINAILISEKFFQIFASLFLLFLSLKYSKNEINGLIIKIITGILSFYILLSSFIPLSVFKIIEKMFLKLNNYVFIKINKLYTKKAEKEITEILDIKKNN